MNKFFYSEKILSVLGLYYLYSLFINSVYNKFKLYNLLKNTPYVKDIINKNESAKEEIDKIFNLPNHQIIRIYPIMAWKYQRFTIYKISIWWCVNLNHLKVKYQEQFIKVY